LLCRFQLCKIAFAFFSSIAYFLSLRGGRGGRGEIARGERKEERAKKTETKSKQTEEHPVFFLVAFFAEHLPQQQPR